MRHIQPGSITRFGLISLALVVVIFIFLVAIIQAYISVEFDVRRLSPKQADDLRFQLNEKYLSDKDSHFIVINKNGQKWITLKGLDSLKLLSKYPVSHIFFNDHLIYSPSVD